MLRSKHNNFEHFKIKQNSHLQELKNGFSNYIGKSRFYIVYF